MLRISIHAQRMGARLAVWAPPQALFEHGLVSLGGVRLSDRPGWLMDASRERAVHELINRVFGLHNLCALCAYGLPCSVFAAQVVVRTKSEAAKPIAPELTREKAAKVLGVSPMAGAAEVKKAFAKRALKAHPDAGGSDDAMHRAVLARDVLLGERVG